MAGSLRLSKTDGFAQYHEFGGTRNIKNSRRHYKGKRIIRKKGGSGPIFKGRVSVKEQAKVGYAGTITTIDQHGKKQVVTYGKLYSDKQARKSTILSEQLWGPFHMKATFPKRPFAKPTLDKIKPSLPKQFANILR